MAYDIKLLGEKLKAKGLDVAEEAAGVIVESVIDWLAESAQASANPYDDVALVVLPKVKEYALKQIDKIDGQPN